MHERTAALSIEPVIFSLQSSSEQDLLWAEWDVGHNIQESCQLILREGSSATRSA